MDIEKDRWMKGMEDKMKLRMEGGEIEIGKLD